MGVRGGIGEKTSNLVDEAELKELADRVALVIVKGLGSRSRWALRTSLDAVETDGIAGICVVKIPPKSKDFIDVTFTVGDVDIISRWSA
jgi:hypothetical protein